MGSNFLLGFEETECRQASDQWMTTEKKISVKTGKGLKSLTEEEGRTLTEGLDGLPYEGSNSPLSFPLARS
jgi:hypothetical protein